MYYHKKFYFQDVLSRPPRIDPHAIDYKVVFNIPHKLRIKDYLHSDIMKLHGPVATNHIIEMPYQSA